MKYTKYITMMLAVVLMLASCASETPEADKVTVAVSIAPQAGMIKAIAGDLVEVVTVIPEGASPANYQPSPKEMSLLSEAVQYFAIGVPAEEGYIMPSLYGINESIEIVYLNQIVSETFEVNYFDMYEETHDDHDHDEDEHDDHDDEDEEHDEDEHDDDEDEHDDHDDHFHEGADPHIWMSPQRVIIMVEVMRDHLIEVDPDNASTYKENAEAYLKELKALHEEIVATTEALEHKSFIIMHPSMGYFATDYGLNMLAIEEDGKETTASRLGEIIDFARDEDIQVIFFQEEFDSAQAETIASEIGGKVIGLDVLNENYIETMTTINQTFSEVLK